VGGENFYPGDMTSARENDLRHPIFVYDGHDLCHWTSASDAHNLILPMSTSIRHDISPLGSIYATCYQEYS
jgi:hypothetical protein